ncbi:MAG: GNAT family N-acetyltransferase [Anaerolineales bacterium]|nr:GNAT family N-acetyltransferase [Anaerolineales bacterium]
MPTVEIRRIEGDELLDTFFPLTTYAFAESPGTQTRADLEKHAPYHQDRYIVAVFEDGVAVATANSIPMTQNVRGKVFKMGGVASVTTMPQARRKGYARQMMQHLFATMFDFGQGVSSLYPFRESFYGRLGYIGFPHVRLMRFNPLNLTPLLQHELAGTVELMHMREGFPIYWDFLQRLQPHQHGFSILSDQLMRRLGEQANVWVAVATDTTGSVVGIMLYQITGFAKELRSSKFLYSNSLGKYLLLQWLGQHADQTRTISLRLPPDHTLETWAFDLNSEVYTIPISEGPPTPMGRVTIVEQLSGIHTGAGAFTAQIVDEYCPWNNGTYCFETVEGQLVVTPAEIADCELSIQGLSALVFCGYDPADFVYRGWGNPDTDTQAVMRSMFPPAWPYVSANF